MTPAVAAGIASLYPVARYPNTDLALAAVGTDAVFACNARKAAQLLSKWVPTHAYEFNDANAPELFLPPITVESFPYAAAHASEIQYLFNLRSPLPPSQIVALTPSQEKLSRTMVDYWTNFARTGNPNWFNTPFWPQYDAKVDAIASLEPPKPRIETGFAADHKCSVWTP